jgi:hypothetical protein
MKVVMSNTGSATVVMLSVLPGEPGLHILKEVIVSPEDFCIGVRPDRKNPVKRASITSEKRTLIIRKLTFRLSPSQAVWFFSIS